MTLQIDKPIDLTEVETEFLAPLGTPLSDFVREGDYVPTNTNNLDVPTELPLALAKFLGTSKDIPAVISLVQDDLFVWEEIDGGIHLANDHSAFNGSIIASDKFVVDVVMRCGTDFTDGDEESPQMAGYSWAHKRAKLVMGPVGGGGQTRMPGIHLTFYFTSSTTGYMSIGVGTEEGRNSAGVWFDQANVNYGNEVIPDDIAAVRVRVTRGEGISLFYDGPQALWALDYHVYIYERDHHTVLWRSAPLRVVPYADQSFYAGPFNEGGALGVANGRITDNMACTLEFEKAEAAIGVFEIP